MTSDAPADFFKFPSTPHVAWLSTEPLRGDKLLTPIEVSRLFSGYVFLEEKIDGANLGFSLDADLRLRAQNRGAYIDLDDPLPQFKPLKKWLAAENRADKIGDILFPDKMLFGEWCHAVHSIKYSKLPDLFLAFDIFDRKRQQFTSRFVRMKALGDSNICSVPLLAEGHMDVGMLKEMLGSQSNYSNKTAEGIYVRRDNDGWLIDRAKLVHPKFTQAIEKHWSGRILEVNHLSRGDASY